MVRVEWSLMYSMRRTRRRRLFTFYTFQIFQVKNSREIFVARIKNGGNLQSFLKAKTVTVYNYLTFKGFFFLE